MAEACSKQPTGSLIKVLIASMRLAKFELKILPLNFTDPSTIVEGKETSKIASSVKFWFFLLDPINPPFDSDLGKPSGIIYVKAVIWSVYSLF